MFKVDYSNPLWEYPLGGTSSSYTATEDCVLIGTIASHYSGTDGELKVNNKRICRTYTSFANTSAAEFVTLPLKTGDVVVAQGSETCINAYPYIN